MTEIKELPSLPVMLWRMWVVFPLQHLRNRYKAARVLGWKTGNQYYDMMLAAAKDPPYGAALADIMESELLKEGGRFIPTTHEFFQRVIAELRANAHNHQEALDRASGRDKLSPMDRLLEDVKELEESIPD